MCKDTILQKITIAKLVEHIKMTCVAFVFISIKCDTLII